MSRKPTETVVLNRLGEAISVTGCFAIASGSALRSISFTGVLWAIAACGNYAWGQVVNDNTLGSESSLVTSPTPRAFQIDGGATRGTNLFHSFSQFSVPTLGSAYFNNEPNIQNIITRVTGRSISNIDGLIRANGTANLFLLNPNGIIFGSNASLNIGGSFVASTASSLNFADATNFSATATPTPPLLTVSVPLGLQYGGNAGTIQVQGSTLKVANGKTLALLGGNVQLNDAFLQAPGGRVELGGVAGSGTIGLEIDNSSLRLNLPQGLAQADVSLKGGTIDVVAGSGGSIKIYGQNLTIENSLVRSGIEQVSGGGNSGGNPGVGNPGVGNPGVGNPGAGNTGGNFPGPGNTGGNFPGGANTGGNASGGANTGGNFPGGVNGNGNPPGGGNTGVNLPSGVNPPGGGNTGSSSNTDNSGNTGSDNNGNVTSIGLDGVTLGGANSGLLANTDPNSTDNGGNIFISSSRRIVLDGATIAVDSKGTGKGGTIQIQADSMTLTNGASISAETTSNTGGNINLQVQDLLLMRHGSRISTTAGTAKAGGDGGNIAIDANFIVAVPQENSDITANAFTGRGGNINITTQGAYGIEFRPKETPLSDITASSQLGVNGVVEINTPDVDPSQGLANLPDEPVNVEVAEGCQTGGKQASIGFFNTGRGGLAPNPYEPISSSNIWEDVPPPTHRTASSASADSASTSPATPPNKIVEAQGWLINEKGKVVLVAQMPVTHSQSRCRLR